jgi:hypothetical protein
MVHKVALGQGFLQILRFALPISLRHGSSHSYITWGMNNKPVHGCISETHFETIYINNNNN